MIFFWWNGYWFSLDISTEHTSEMNLDGMELSLTYEVGRILKPTSELNDQSASGYACFCCTAADLRPRILWSETADGQIAASWRDGGQELIWMACAGEQSAGLVRRCNQNAPVACEILTASPPWLRPVTNEGVHLAGTLADSGERSGRTSSCL